MPRPVLTCQSLLPSSVRIRSFYPPLLLFYPHQSWPYTLRRPRGRFGLPHNTCFPCHIHIIPVPSLSILASISVNPCFPLCQSLLPSLSIPCFHLCQSLLPSLSILASLSVTSLLPSLSILASLSVNSLLPSLSI